MEITKNISLSDCCEYKMIFCPPALGDPGFHVCEKCNKACTFIHKTIRTHRKIKSGHYRPINNSKYGY